MKLDAGQYVLYLLGPPGMHGIEYALLDGFRHHVGVLLCNAGNLLLQLDVDQGRHSNYDYDNNCYQAEYFCFKCIHHCIMFIGVVYHCRFFIG